ncbi:ankyrin repeat domain-containing protein [Luteolibacter algae]|uniref:Ankyrin repeat domain-containing protein n=1 Tax=Luteolibacter algae TaxID=454151 RepID=A0ABW5D2W1_9BACT
MISALFLVPCCDSPEEHSLRQLVRDGIQPSGRALVDAVTLDEKQHVRWLLDVRVHIEQRDARGYTPLRIAVENDSPDIAVMLLGEGANPNAKGPDGVDILGVAIEKNDSAVVEKLIKAGANPAGRMANGEKILPWAIRNGRLAYVRSMFKEGADPHMKDDAGNPLLHIAVNAGHLDLVTTLISLGADPGATDAKGRGVLALAAKNRWMHLLPELAVAGADPNLPDPRGHTLLERAIAAHDTKLIPVLMKIGADPVRIPTVPGGVTPLEAAIATGHLPTLRALLRPGESLDGPEWEPALWLAYRQNNKELARMLLNKGARAFSPGESGLLLTEVATISQRVGWLKLLLDYGHPLGKSIFYASYSGDTLTVDFLLESGCPADFTMLPYLDTALSVAMRKGYDRIASMLLRHGAKANLRLPENQKPLHLALVTGNAETVRELLAAGADPNEAVIRPVSETFLRHVRSRDMKWYLTRDRNITPLMLAANTGVLASARYLLDAGAQKNTYTKVNYTWPINFASRRSDVPMMRLLLGQDPDKSERHIVLSLKEQRARVYNSDGEEVFSTKVSSGKSGYRTRQGEFVITDKHRHHNSSIYGSSMPYFQRLSCSDFGFHYGYVPGYPASHGCIRLPMGAAKKLFAMTKVGDRVTIEP